MNDALIQRMRSPGPKKILACDGGGILGLMSVEILARHWRHHRGLYCGRHVDGAHPRVL